MGLVTAAFLALVVGGILAITLLGGGGHKAGDKCSTATSITATR